MTIFAPHIGTHRLGEAGGGSPMDPPAMEAEHD